MTQKTPPKRRGRIAGRLHLDRRAADLAKRVAADGHDDDLLDTEATANLIGSSVNFLQVLRQRDDGPPFRRVGALAVYRRLDLVHWLKGRANAFMAKAPETIAFAPVVHIIRGAPTQRLVTRREDDER